MEESDIVDQTDIRLVWPLLGAVFVWAYLGAVIASVERDPFLIVVGAVVLAAIVYHLTARTHVDLGYVFVGAAGLTVFAAGLFFGGDRAFFLFGTVLSGSLFSLPIAILAQQRAVPKVPGWIANLGAGVVCLCVIEAASNARGHLGEWPALSSIALVGVPAFAALSAFSFYHLICHVVLLLGRLAVHLVYRIKYEGVDQVPHEGGFLACANHVSYIDWLLMVVPLQRPYRFVADHAYIPDAFRWFLIGGGCIPIASVREDRKVMAEGLRRISEELGKGHAVGIHPEGYMTRTGYLQPIQPGVERIVSVSKVPVVPVFIDGMYGSFLSRKYGRRLGKGDWSFRRRVLLRFGPPIQPEGFSKQLLEEKLVELGAIRESDRGVESHSKHEAAERRLRQGVNR